MQNLQLFESDGNYHVAALQNFSAKRAIFESPVVFDLQFEECPDFSETHFLKKVSIKETWLKAGEVIEDSKIKAEDEAKFRFFKNYFAKEEGNHFKEQEYFSYEMKAREKRMKQELKNEPWNFAKMANWFLFKFYKWTSNYGMSIKKPLIALFGVFVLRILQTYCDQSLPDWSEIFAFAFEKTVFPLQTKGFDQLHPALHSFWSVVFSVFSLVFLFLLLLGIRNRFKIK